MKRVELWATLLYYRYQREHFLFFIIYEIGCFCLFFFPRAFSEFTDLVNLLLVTCHLIARLNIFEILFLGQAVHLVLDVQQGISELSVAVSRPQVMM